MKLRNAHQKKGAFRAQKRSATRWHTRTVPAVAVFALSALTLHCSLVYCPPSLAQAASVLPHSATNSTPNSASAQARSATGLVPGHFPGHFPRAGSESSALSINSKPGNSKKAAFKVEIIDFSPVLTTNGLPREESFSIRLALQNTDTVAHRARLQLWVQRSTPVSRADLDQWASGKTSLSTARLSYALSVGTLPPAGQRELILTVPATSLPLSNMEQWGPRGFALTATPELDIVDDQWAFADEPGELTQRVVDPQAPTAQSRNWLLWDNGAQFDPSRLAVISPLTLSPTQLQALYGQALREINTAANPQAAPGQSPPPSGQDLDAQRLSQLCKLAENPYVSPLIDPVLTLDTAPWRGLRDLLSTAAASPATQAEAEPAHNAAGQPADNLDKLNNSLPVRINNCGAERASALPVADFSVSRLRTAGLSSAQEQVFTTFAKALSQRLNQAAQELPSLALLPGIPGQAGALSPGNLAAETHLWPGRTPILTPDDPLESATFDPSAYRRVEIEGRPLGILLGDPQLSQALSGKAPADFTLTSGPTSRQWLLAQTAILTRQRPFDQRSFVATTPRQVNPELLSQGLQALSQARWFSPVSLPTLLQNPPDLESLPKTSLATLSPWPVSQRPVSEQAVSPRPTGDASALQLLERSGKILERSRDFAKILPADSLFSLWASAAALGPAATSGGTQTPLDLIDRVIGGVSTQPSSTINLIDKTAALPIGVSNYLRQPISVTVAVHPSDSRLKVDAVDVLQISPNSAKSAHIPVAAIGSGDVTLQVRLLSPQGDLLYQASEIKVRVRAQWESTGTLVVAGLLAGVLLLGITRNIRKGRRREKTS